MSAYSHWPGLAGNEAVEWGEENLAVWVREARDWLADMQNAVSVECFLCIVYCLPCNTPVWFNALDGGVFYVLKGEALPDLGVVHAHADLHWANPRQGRGGVTHYLCHGPSANLI